MHFKTGGSCDTHSPLKNSRCPRKTSTRDMMLLKRQEEFNLHVTARTIKKKNPQVCGGGVYKDSEQAHA